MSASLVRARAFAALLVLSTVACFPEGVTTMSRAPSAVAANTTPASPAAVSSAASPLPSVIVRDKKGKPVAGVPVIFSVASGGGTVTGASQTTDAQGIATVGGWTLGATVGMQSLVASAEPLPQNSAAGDKLPPVTFTVEAKAMTPSQMVKIGDGQTGVVASALAQQVGVQLKDGAGNPVGGASVTFAAGNGSSVNPTTVSTNASGQALTTWTMGNTAGGASLTASSGTLTPATLSATAVAGAPARLTLVGDAQTGTVGKPLANLVGVTVLDAHDNVVQNVDVSFVGANGSAVSPATVKSDVSGQALTQWSLGTVAGAMSVSATVGSLAPVSLSATAVAGPPATMDKENDAQTGTVGQALAQPVGVVVKDSYGNIVKNYAVTFAPGNGSSVPAATVNTDANGRASTAWTMGHTAGWASMTATAGSAPSTTLTAQALAGPAFQLSGQNDNQTGQAGATLDQPIVVFVGDEWNNPVENATVSFSPSDGAVNPSSATTGANGLAQTAWTLGSSSGTISLTATVGSLTPLTFHATVQAPDPCAAISSLGVPQTLTGDLRFSECVYGGPQNGMADVYAMPLTASTPMEIWVESPDFDTHVTLYRDTYSAMADVLAFNDDGFDSGTNSRVQFLGGAGNFLIGVENQGIEKGAYRLSTKTWNGALDACNVVFAVSGTSTNQFLDNGDCKRGTPTIWADKVMLYLHAGETVQMTMRSSAFDSKIDVERRINGSNTVVASNDNGGGGVNGKDAQLTLTAAVTDYYTVYLTTAGTSAVGGAYSLSIMTPPGGTPAVTASVRATTTSTRQLGETARAIVNGFRTGTKEPRTTVRQ